MFNEQAYLLANPDVAAAVANGSISSGLEHYTKFGQFENRAGFFFGTRGNDTITSFGQRTILAGVAFDDLLNGATVTGVGEVDTLIGTEGKDVFVLGHPNLSSLPSSPQQLTSSPQQFYVGGGNTDYALIKNLDRLNDIIVLEGSPENYNLRVINGSANIFTASGDLVGIVEDVRFPLIVPGDSLNITRFIPANITGPFSGVV